MEHLIGIRFVISLISYALLANALESRQTNGAVQKLLLQQLLGGNLRSSQSSPSNLFQGNMNAPNGNPGGQNLLSQLLGQGQQSPQPAPPNLLQNLLDFNRPQYDQPLNNAFSGGMTVGSVGPNSNSNSGGNGNDPLVTALVQLLQNKNNGMGNSYNAMDYQNAGLSNGGQQRPGLLQQQQNGQQASTNNLLSLLLGSNNGQAPQNNGLAPFMPSNSNMQPSGLNSFGAGGNGINNNNVLNDLLNALTQQGSVSQPNNNILSNSGNGQNMMSSSLPGFDLGLIAVAGNGSNAPRLSLTNPNMAPLNDGLSGLAALLANNNGGSTSQSNPLLSLLG